MLYILIRTCPRDDYIGRLAYESLKEFYPDAIYGFLAEQGSYSHITDTIYWRPKCDNFGGHLGARVLCRSLADTRIHPNDDDVVFLVDSDIIMLRHLGDDIYNVDHGGVYGTGRWNLGHVSGQFQILSGSFFKLVAYLPGNELDKIVIEMCNKGMDIADDTVMSYLSDFHGLRKKHIHGWIHWKFFEYNGRPNYRAVIDEIRERSN